MYCQKCGKEIMEGETICKNCGNVNRTTTDAVVYDYLTVNVKDSTKQLVIDTYENLGWEKISNGFGTINLKRNRHLNNKSELRKIEHQIDSSIKKIERYEATKKSKGTIVSIIIGVIGALIMGTGMSLVMEFNQMILGILLGSLGIIICIPCYPVYKGLVHKSTNKVLPLIEEEYDKIESLCDEAISLMK